MPPRLKVVTAGCKSNFADSSAIVRKALSLGFVLAADGSPADVVVVNGCTVTHRADRDSRALARRARRENPGARIVVTGCFAETGGAAEELLPEADLRIPPSSDPSLASFLASSSAVDPGTPPPLEEPSVHASDLLLGHRRTFLKVQDGCDSRCAYCAIPLARGAERSVPAEEAVAAAVRAEASGAREIVLTGIHVGRYGADRGEGDGLASLLAALLCATREARFRLGSVEPLEVSERLLSLAGSSPRVCPHFHVPLQSGSAGILRRMGRPCPPERYRETVRAIRAALPGARVGADVIAGFPGETEDQFAETAALLREEGIDYLHAFPYSARTGTAASLLADDVPPGEKKRRVAELLALDREAREADMARRTGGIEEMVAERHDPSEGTLHGTTGSYHVVRLPGGAAEAGRLLKVRLASRSGRVFLGERLP